MTLQPAQPYLRLVPRKARARRYRMMIRVEAVKAKRDPARREEGTAIGASS
ncbi:MAG: hypothetical protein AVDCRST_MAG80-870 [uncultured Rubrobacteraceae bacterium]|uniref:Uncharacterized protein n=1 Tax=uncultured Rubrobacteraceae bacterium TaxID=349277 RepID=A0A6J4QEF8_9ACTN|nr:MAG: hypothetical protein AVDCRST_MAG80-870 [uncultured Rubrobacteraceae bacterium]